MSNKLKEIVEELYPQFEKELKKEMESMDKRKFELFCHGILSSGGVSMHIRNKYKLWDKESENHKYFKSLGHDHPDDMSAVIVGKIWEEYRKVNN